jgi:DNA-binding CsgD family transcriptional regulator/tetratricopeptide (TPR) repeat protein
LILSGREAETARIGSFLRELPKGSCVLLLEGEAGIGKTTLLEYGRKAALELDLFVLSARPVETEMALAYAGLADLLEPIPQSLVDTLPPPQRQAIRQAVLRMEPARDPIDPRTTSTAVRTLLRSLADTNPIVVIVDDLPWLDPASARTLSFALRRMDHEPVGLLAAARTSWSVDEFPLGVEGMPPGKIKRVRVSPLSLRAMRELLGTHFGLFPGRSKLVRLHEICGGNPLYALELGERIRLNPQSSLSEWPDVPEPLRRLVLGRIVALPAEARDVLLVCALATDAALPVIYAAARRRATAQADLEKGVREGLVTIADSQVSFVHPVIRSVVIGEAQPAERRAAHCRLASVVGDIEAKARHLALGAQAPDESVGLVIEESARIAAHRGACEIAGDLAEMAATLTPIARAKVRQRRIILAAEQLFEASNPVRACSLLEGILDAVPSGPGRGEVLRRLARYRVFRGAPVAVWRATLQQALTESGRDSALRTVILLDQAVVASNSGDYPEAKRYGLLAMESAEHTGDAALQAQCCAGLAFLEFVTGEGVKPDLIERARDGPAQPQWLSMEKRPNVVVGHVLHWAGDLDGARACYEEEYARALAEGVETDLPLVLWAMSENEAWAGDWQRALQLASEGYSLAEDSASPVAIAFMSAARGLVHAYQGRIELARSDAARTVDLARALGVPLLAIIGVQPLGIAALSVGDARGAHRQLGSLAETVLTVGMPEPSLCRFVPDEIEALTRLGESDMAGALLDLFEARSVQVRREWGVGAARRCLGLLRASRGDLNGASTALEAALGVHRQLQMPFEEARTLLVAGEVHRRARHKRMAASFLREAVQAFDRLGAPLWTARAQDELDRVGIRGPRAESGPGLTAAERRVADLVVTGCTNNEIAAALFMGQRTVEAHLSRVYRKLGVRSRTGLCRVLATPDVPVAH